VSGARDATFRAIADPSRRRMIEALADGERTVNELCSLFDTSQPAVSQHLRVLRDAGLVRHRRHGRHRYYRLEAAPLREVYDWSAHYRRFWVKKLDALAALLTREAARARKKRGDA
jgi:DNA-binding transcriptional ArsR family regulator